MIENLRNTVKATSIESDHWFNRFIKNSKITIIVFITVVLLIMGIEAIQFKKDPYERWVDQLMSPSIEVVSIALSSALNMNDPRVVELLRKAWLDEQQIIHNELLNQPLAKLELANVLFFLTDEYDKEYFEFIVKQLGSEDGAVKTYATLLLALNPSDSTVDILENIIINENIISSKNAAVSSLSSIALTSSYALNLMKKLVTDKRVMGTAVEGLLRQEIKKVERIKEKGARAI